MLSMPTMPLREKLNPQHTALLVIDIQNDFCSPAGLLAKRGRDLSSISAMIDRLIPFIDQAKAALVDTLFIKQVYDWDKLNARQREQYELDGRLVSCDIATEGHQFYRIRPPVADTYVKYTFSPFSNPQVQERLNQKNIKTLVITGVDAEYCVENAIRSAFDLGFKIVVPSDLIATNAKKNHRQERLLELLEANFGVVSSAGEISALWSAQLN